MNPFHSDNKTTRFIIPLRYNGSIAFLIISFLLLVTIPVGLFLILKNTYYVNDNDTFHIHYMGSWNWIFFWATVCFPIAIVLMFIKGTSIVQTHFNPIQNDNS